MNALIQFVPYKTPGLLKTLVRSVEWERQGTGRDIYLTFDDGPVEAITPYVLETLEAYKVKATFFCVGDNVRKHPAVFRSVIDAGHGVANHTFNHLAGWGTDLHVYLENVAKCDREIQRHHNPEKPGSKLFRPPYGRITPAQVRALKKEYKIVMWSLLANDFVQGHSPEKSLQQLFRYTRPGSIVLFHDSIKTEKKLKYMLPRFLQFGIEQGYTFKLLD